MQALLCLVLRLAVRGVQALPLRFVAWIGRQGGGAAYWLDRRHRQVALENLERCFGQEKSPEKIRALAKENFRRLGESYLSSLKTASMTVEEIRQILTVSGHEKIQQLVRVQGISRFVFITGHFGNFELCARTTILIPELQFMTTYRALGQTSLTRVLQDLRAQSGLLFFERREEGESLRKRLAEGRFILGLFADQHAGKRGLATPFFGIECSTSPAPAVLALRYRAPIFPAICYRTSLGRWRLEVGEEIPTREDGKARSVAAITADVNRVLETAVRRDPANWFWVHRRWKRAGRRR